MRYSKGHEMFQIGDPRRVRFEAAIYNRDVRAAVKNNGSHPVFDDRWADLQNLDVTARTEFEALALLAERYPPDQGFVVVELVRARLAA